MAETDIQKESRSK